MRKKRALNLSLQPGIIEWGNKIMAEKRYASLSVLVEELIRERYYQIFGGAPRADSDKSSNSRYTLTAPQLNEVHDKPAPKKRKAA